MIEVIAGVRDLCAYCGALCDWWWRGADFYACVHPQCAEHLAARCPALLGRAAAAVVVNAPARRGAYARRGGVQTAALFIPSRFAGHTRNDAWLAVAETNTGQVTVPCGGNAGHGVSVMWNWELLAVGGQPIGNGGVRAIGGALFDPDGEAAMAWGWQPERGQPAYEPIYQVQDWFTCPQCGMWVWPGRWVRVADRACRWCLSGTDNRTWPVEADFPGDAFVPDHMRDDAPKGRRRRTVKEFNRGEHD